LINNPNDITMGKNIIVCYDGTGNEYGKNNTNVVHIFESILREDDQIAFYDPGVGTFSYLGRYLGRRVGIILGKAFGAGLQQNLEDGYEYLMNRYEKNDRLYLFGFSRGAYTARALSGMLYHFGLLPKGSKNLIPYVSKMYTSKNFGNAPGFKKTFSHECKPYFIGVWDTVGSLGFIYGKKFYNTRLMDDVQYAYQAVSIDEKRKKFPVSLWDEKNILSGQVIEQVWFPGVHSDVGGWYEERHLSDIAFGWLMDKAASCGLKLHPGWDNLLAQDATGKIHESRVCLWKIWKPVTRTISEGALVHKSVKDRIEKKDDYQPKLPSGYKVVSNATYDKGSPS
jgi:uncharacterized protein (DUF2235 family)